MSREFVHIQNVLHVLNDLALRDPEVMHALVNFRVPCNQRIVEHPTVITHQDSRDPARVTVGLLGILNGLFGRDPDGGGPIAAVHETTCGRCGAVLDARVGDTHIDCGGTIIRGRLLYFKRREIRGVSRGPEFLRLNGVDVAEDPARNKKD